MIAVAFQARIVALLREMHLDISYRTAIRALLLVSTAYVGAVLAAVTSATHANLPATAVTVAGHQLGLLAVLAAGTAIVGGATAVVGAHEHRARDRTDPRVATRRALRSALGCDALAAAVVDNLAASGLRAVLPVALLVGAASTAGPGEFGVLVVAAGVGTSLLATAWVSTIRTDSGRSRTARRRWPMARAVGALALGALARSVLRPDAVVLVGPALTRAHVWLAAVTAGMVAAVALRSLWREVRHAHGAALACPTNAADSASLASLRARGFGRAVVRLVVLGPLLQGVDRSPLLLVVTGVGVAQGGWRLPATDGPASLLGLAVATSVLTASATVEPDLLLSGRAVRAAYERGPSPAVTFVAFTVAQLAHAAVLGAAMVLLWTWLTAGSPAAGALVVVAAVSGVCLGRAVAGDGWSRPSDSALTVASMVALGVTALVAVAAATSTALAASAVGTVLVAAYAVWTRRTRYR